jgi:hypothetical protein
MNTLSFNKTPSNLAESTPAKFDLNLHVENPKSSQLQKRPMKALMKTLKDNDKLSAPES